MPERESGPRGQRLHQRELPAERAAERFGDDADVLERETERPRELPLGHERPLRARRDD